MPYVVNGIGTWYWGRRNITSRRSGCEACGAVGDLRSYETTLFFVVFFVPLLPLGRKRILDECPRCKRHRAAKLAEYERMRIETLESAVSDCVANPADADKALAALTAAAVYRDHKTFLGLVERTRAVLADHAEGQLLLGEAFDDIFGDHGAAEAALRRAFELKPGDEDARRMLAAHVLRFGDPDEGWDLIRPVVFAEPGERVGLALLAVEAFQVAGRHDAAVAVLDEFERAAPEVAGTKAFRGFRKLAAKRARKGKPVKSPLVGDAARNTPDHVRPRRWAFAAAWLVGPAVVACGLAFYSWLAWSQGRSREVHIVNGLGYAYTAEVGGAPVQIPRRGRAVVHLPEGVVTVRIPDAQMGIADQTVEIRTPFWSRPVSDRTFVINPDHQAVLIREEVHYSTTSGAAPPSDFTLHVGRPLHEFAGVDYPFTPPPPQITSKRSGGTITKVVLQLESTRSSDDMAMGVEQFVGTEAALDFIKRGALLDPADPGYARLLREYIPPRQVLETVRPALARRPVAIDAHRLYQDYTERLDPAHDLVAEYRALLAADEGNPALIYLLGRVVADRAEADGLWRRAGEAAEPVVQAWGAIAYDAMARADFQAALAAVQRGLAIDKHHDALLLMEMSILDALGGDRLGEWLARPQHASAIENIDGGEMLSRVYAMLRAGRAADAREALRRWRTYAGEEGISTAHYADGVLAYCEGDEAAYAAAMATVGHAETTLSAAIAAGDLAAAERAAADMPPGPGEPQVRLMLLLTAFRLREGEQLGRLHEHAVAALRAGGREERAAAAWLAGEVTPTETDLRTIPLHPVEKHLFLAALGLRRPELRDPCFGLARELNFDRRFPHLLVRAVTDPETAQR